MTDLKPFCSTDEARPYLHTPASRDGHTYATNGHILIRIDQQDDIPEREEFPNCERVISICDFGQPMGPLPSFEMPSVSEIECQKCEGRGHEHDCPECECDCYACEATGKSTTDAKKSITLDGIGYALKYIRILSSLPGLEIPAKTKDADPMPFRFNGGIGCLMPLRTPLEINTVVRP